MTPGIPGLGDESAIRQFVEGAPDALVVVDAAGLIALVNGQTERMFGYATDELLGRPIETLVPERARAAHAHHRRAYGQAPRVRPMGASLELVGRRRDGSEFPVEISLSPLQTPSGTFTWASIRDISERRRAESETRRVQAHLLSAVESIQGAFAIFDARDALVMCNSEYRRLMGRDVTGEMVGRSYGELLELGLRSATFRSGPALEELRSRCLAYHRRPDGVLDLRAGPELELRLAERRTAEGGTVLTILDITDDVSRAEELRSARSLAEAASAAKSEFLASMSHELRTPLNAILGFAQLLQRDRKLPLSERHKDRVDHIVKGGEHLLRLIDDVLDLARIEAGRVLVSPERVHVPEVMREVHDTLEPIASRAGITVTLEPLPDALPEVVADRTRFRQVLMNFGSNAIKYGRAGGVVTLGASVRGERVRVRVADDGIGIPRDKQDKIFQPFQRAGQETGPIEGTGIGLAISRKLAELMGGEVGFSSAEGRGSEFWIELASQRPTSQDPLAAPAVLPRDSALSGEGGPRVTIVYVEDNPSNIAFMSALLGDFDRVDLQTAPNAELGIELVRAQRPRLVIMDINLPGMSGFEAVRRLKEWEETRDIPVLALSAAAMVRDADKIREAGFHRYLTKPVDVDALAAVLEELLGDTSAP